MKIAENINAGDRHVSLHSRNNDLRSNSRSSSIWDPNRSMTEQLREEKETLFGKQAKVYSMLSEPRPAVLPEAALPKAVPEGWLTRKETAEALGVSTWTLDHWTHPIKLNYVIVKNPYLKYYYDPEIIKQIQQTEWFTSREGKKRTYASTPEEQKKRKREWLDKNKDKVREYNTKQMNKRYALNPDKFKNRAKQRRQKLKEKQNVADTQ